LKERPKLYLILSHDIREILDREARRREAEAGGKWTRTLAAEALIRWAVEHMQRSETVT